MAVLDWSDLLDRDMKGTELTVLRNREGIDSQSSLIRTTWD